jgi:hypothetical protein
LVAIKCFLHGKLKKMVICCQAFFGSLNNKNSKECLMATITTLALSLLPRQGLAKVQANNEARESHSCSQECKRVWGNAPSHSQVSSYFGSWSFDGFLNLQRIITKVKTHGIEKFLISFESSWNVNV